MKKEDLVRPQNYENPDSLECQYAEDRNTAIHVLHLFASRIYVPKDKDTLATKIYFLCIKALSK